MNFDLIMKVNEQFTKIKEILGIKCGVILNNDEKNILAGLHFDDYKIPKKDQDKILRRIRRLSKYFDINHVILNNHVVIFQGKLKEVK